MLNTHRQWFFVPTWIIVAIAIWFVAVPSLISVPAFFWLNATAAGIGILLVTIVRAGGATRSIAHVLYDTENQTDAGSMTRDDRRAGQWPSSRETIGRRS
jgi:hypothetical protein